MAKSSDNLKEKREKDAYEFALLLYDIYKEEQSNASMATGQNNSVYTDEEKPCQELSTHLHSAESHL
ncbi:MAG TPA: hypothetical protein VLG09_05385 [Candidatus Saccharimonadales bacterium]|nr:hypothetical protein [Candidatus Saccharimonadales bacterium]